MKKGILCLKQLHFMELLKTFAFVTWGQKFILGEIPLT